MLISPPLPRVVWLVALSLGLPCCASRSASQFDAGNVAAAPASGPRLQDGATAEQFVAADHVQLASHAVSDPDERIDAGSRKIPVSVTTVADRQEPTKPSSTGPAKRWSLQNLLSSQSSPAKHRSIDELLLFFPSKFPEGNWKPANLQYQDVWFSAADRTRLHGWYCPCDNPRAIVLIAHGNAGHLASRAPWLQYLQSQARVSAFMFDYRGYGRSEGVPTAEGVLADARAARAKLCELAGVNNGDIVLMGESLGGAVVVHLAAESAPRGLILQSTFSSLRDVADVHFPGLSRLVPRDKLDSATQIARYHGPLLQSHGTADETIPLDCGKKLFRAANEPKEFIEIPGAGHNNWLNREYLTSLDQFLTQLPRAPETGQ